MSLNSFLLLCPEWIDKMWICQRVGAGCSGLRITGLVVPSEVNLGSDVHLQCHYDLEGSNLYALKWYKGSHGRHTIRFLLNFLQLNIPWNQQIFNKYWKNYLLTTASHQLSVDFQFCILYRTVLSTVSELIDFELCFIKNSIDSCGRKYRPLAFSLGAMSTFTQYVKWREENLLFFISIQFPFDVQQLIHLFIYLFIYLGGELAESTSGWDGRRSSCPQERHVGGGRNLQVRGVLRGSHIQHRLQRIYSIDRR